MFSPTVGETNARSSDVLENRTWKVRPAGSATRQDQGRATQPSQGLRPLRTQRREAQTEVAQHRLRCKSPSTRKAATSGVVCV